MFSEYAMTLPAGQFPSVPAEATPPPLALMENDIITPEQFFNYARNSAVAWSGERRLLLAVLEEAVIGFLRYKDAHTTRGKRLFREECEWFWSHERHYLYAFETICDHLYLDPEYIRNGLQKLRLMADPMPWIIETERGPSYRRAEV